MGLCVLGATRQASPWHSLSRCGSVAHRWQKLLSWGSCNMLLVWKQELCQGFLTLPQALEEQSSEHIPSGKRNGEIMEIATFLFPSQLSALVLQSNKYSPLGLCQGCSGVASVPETSVICVLSLNLMVFRKTIPLHEVTFHRAEVTLHRAGHLLLCSPAAQQTSWSCGCLRNSPPSA